ncbi:MAG: hypothetical protein IPM95_14120 [Sphingobacteriales bacterium]|nr:hypothetical protein [Sphingobacteriales bacterium]
MKAIMKKWMLLVFVFGVISCTKDGDKLGGQTDLDLTKVEGSDFAVSIASSGEDFPVINAGVISNNGGDVTFRITLDFTGHPDSAVLVPLIPAYLKDDQNRVKHDIKMRFTSQGIQDYEENPGDKPFTIVKYDARVGDTYMFKTNTGEVLTRTVTERTDENDWPFTMFNIKTIKVEQNEFDDIWEPIIEKVVWRANHKYGLVYMEAVLKNGKILKADIIPWHII